MQQHPKRFPTFLKLHLKAKLFCLLADHWKTTAKFIHILDAQVFSVIPAKAGIQWASAAAWIPGLRSAAPGMTPFTKSCVQKT